MEVKKSYVLPLDDILEVDLVEVSHVLELVDHLEVGTTMALLLNLLSREDSVGLQIVVLVVRLLLLDVIGLVLQLPLEPAPHLLRLLVLQDHLPQVNRRLGQRDLQILVDLVVHGLVRPQVVNLGLQLRVPR